MPVTISSALPIPPNNKGWSDYLTIESGFYHHLLVGGLVGGFVSLYRQGAFCPNNHRPTFFGRESDVSADSDDDSDRRADQLFRGNGKGTEEGGAAAYGPRSTLGLSAIRRNATDAEEAQRKLDQVQRSVTAHYFADARR